MTPLERQSVREILAEVRQAKAVSAEDLARRYGVSLETIRRDLRGLRDRGLLERVYGGALSVRSTEGDFATRSSLHAARKQAMLRNFEFFGAPVGLFFTMERSLLLGSWLDCGMFMQNVMILARAHGLETCPQQAWCEYGRVVHEQLRIPDTHIMLSGMALGQSDPDAPENTLISDRVSTEDFVVFHE